MFITQGKPNKLIPNLRIATYDSDSGIYRTFLAGNLMGCLCSIIDTKRIPMPRVIDSVCHRPGFWINIGNIKVLVIACSSLSIVLGPFSPSPGVMIPTLVILMS